MIRPGTSRPGIGDHRNKQLRQRLAQMLQRKAGPRFAGAMGRRPVAGPGVRQFGGQGGPLMPGGLDMLTTRLGGAVVPFGRANPGAPGGGISALDQLPDPAAGMAGGPDGMSPFSGRGGPQRDRPVFNSEDVSQALPQGPGQTSQAQQVQGLPMGGVENIIPLGNGAYYDVSTGMLHGIGGGMTAY